MEDVFRLTDNRVHCAEARITAVNPATWEVNLVTEGPNTLYAVDVPWLSSYRGMSGGGIDFIPTVGDQCVCLWTPQSVLPVILGFCGAYHTTARYASSRLDTMSEGDVCMWTDRGNRVHLKQNGDVWIASEESCKQVFVAARRAVETLCNEWLLTTAGVTWRMESDPDTKRTRLVCEVRPSEDADPVFQLFVGDVQNTHWFSLTVGECNVTIDKQSKVEAFLQDVSLNMLTLTEVAENHRWEVKETLDAKVHQTQWTGNTWSLSTDKEITLRSPSVELDSPLVKVGRGASHPSVRGDVLARLFATHTHATFGVPPTEAALVVDFLSTGVLLP